jgi:hypothetical protein
MPAPGVQPAPRLGPIGESAPTAGLRVVAVRDARAPLVELRLRLPLRAAGWCHPHHAAALARQLAGRTGLAARADQLGGELRVSTDGQWLDFAGYLPAARVADGLALLGRVLAPLPAGAEPVPVTRLPRDPVRVTDDALRRHWLAAEPPPAPGPARQDRVDLAALHRSIVDGGWGWLVAVGDLDPDRFLARVDRAVAGWPSLGHPQRHAPRPEAAPLLVIRDRAATDLHLSLCAPEPAGGAGEPARYLAAAVVGSYYRSRLAARAVRSGLGYQSFAGRDVCLTVPRVYLRAELPAGDAGRAAAGIRAELAALWTDPVTGAELAGAREYCTAQLLSAFDSAAVKADVMRQGLVSGREPTWLAELPDLLARTGPAELAAASRELFALGRMTTVLVGSPDRVAGVLEHLPADATPEPPPSPADLGLAVVNIPDKAGYSCRHESKIGGG